MSSRAQVQGKVALVTGASQGIGKGIALRLARDGFDVAINDIPAASAASQLVVSEIRALGRKALCVLADVTSAPDVEEMVEKVAAELGSVDVVIANAGIAGAIKPLLELTAAERGRVLAVNIEGLMNTYIAGARQMVKQGKGGRIIGACSIAAYSTSALQATYCASKWAVRGFTQASAKEWAPYGIRVNAYAPGIVGTPMWDEIDAGFGREMGWKSGEAIGKKVDGVLLGRVSTPEDVAKLVSFLASEDAEFITGQTMIVDGGVCFT